MKIRLINGFCFGGAYSEEFLLENWSNEINGSLVSDWQLIDAELPDENIIKAKWDGSVWFESATSQEILNVNQSKIDAINAFYTTEISKLVAPYVEKSIIDGVAIPQSILDQRTALRAECNLKIHEIDPHQEMSKPGDNEPINLLEKKS